MTAVRAKGEDGSRDVATERRKYLGASEVAAVCRLCPFGSPLTVWAK